jgi:hypothetical protein
MGLLQNIKPARKTGENLIDEDAYILVAILEKYTVNYLQRVMPLEIDNNLCSLVEVADIDMVFPNNTQIMYIKSKPAILIIRILDVVIQNKNGISQKYWEKWLEWGIYAGIGLQDMYFYPSVFKYASELGLSFCKRGAMTNGKFWLSLAKSLLPHLNNPETIRFYKILDHLGISI